jgi:signal transduction histidine kinase
LTLTVDDNGGGFVTAEKHPGGLGLIGMRERAQALDGSLMVHSTLGRGTRVILELTVPSCQGMVVA